MLFDNDTWIEWLEKIEEGFEQKSYYHFDQPFNLKKQKGQLKKLLEDPQNLASHAFLPFVRRNMKTRRFHYDRKKDDYIGSYKVRPIAFSSHFDSYIYSYCSFALNDRYQQYIRENKFSECVLAYRTDLDGKCNIQFAKEVFEYIRSVGECTAVALDIKGYFDSIDHQKLKEKWCKLLNTKNLPPEQYKIFRSITNYSFVDYNTFVNHFNVNFTKFKKNGSGFRATLTDVIPGTTFKSKFGYLRSHNLIATKGSHELLIDGQKRHFGIPQGSPISAFLSNLYLIDFDQLLSRLAKERGFLYRRYCDDILIVSSPHIADEIVGVIENKISAYHLKVQDKKTEIIGFRKDKYGKIRSFDAKKIAEKKVELSEENESKYYKNLQYLGFEFNGQNIYLRPSSLSRYFRKMKRRVLKSVLTAYGKKGWSKKVFRKQIYERYTHFGKRNFLSYAYNASKKYYVNSKGERKEGMGDKKIRQQIARHFDILENQILEKELQVSRSKKYNKNRG
jgi:glutaredoxin 2